MSRGVRLWILGAIAGAALTTLAGCGHNFYSGEREAWRREAEIACLNSGAIKESPARVRISAISGPGMCGVDYPIRVSALGESGPLSYSDEPVRPPAALSSSSAPQYWPVVQSNTLPPNVAPEPAPKYGPSAAPQGRPSPAASAQLGPMRSAAPAAPGRPTSLYAQEPQKDNAAFVPEPPHLYDGTSPSRGRSPSAPSYPQRNSSPPPYTPRQGVPPGIEEHVPLGPVHDPGVTASAGPVEVKPTATLACPLVSALDQWVATAVQPAAWRWFHQPVVEIKQISAYSCRGMNGDSNGQISEHAFGNALDIAGFVLADGHNVTVQYGWHGSAEEQAFLHDVQLAACNELTTVLAPGANIYHYDHIHLDLMRRYSGQRICEPAAIPGEVIAERVRAQYVSYGYGGPNTTGSISKKVKRALGFSSDDEDRLPLAGPGKD
jgi:hypothetical protein